MHYGRSKIIISKVLTENHVSSYLCYTVLSGSPYKSQRGKKSSHFSGSDHLTYNQEHSSISFFFFLPFLFLIAANEGQDSIPQDTLVNNTSPISLLQYLELGLNLDILIFFSLFSCYEVQREHT